VGNQLPFKDPLGDGLVYPFMDDFFWGEKPVDCRIFEIPWDLIFFTETQSGFAMFPLIST